MELILRMQSCFNILKVARDFWVKGGHYSSSYSHAVVHQGFFLTVIEKEGPQVFEDLLMV